MTDAERNRAWLDGLQRRDIRLCGSGGNSWGYWQARIAGEAKRKALEAESARPHYFYGDGPYLYESEAELEAS